MPHVPNVVLSGTWTHQKLERDVWDRPESRLILLRVLSEGWIPRRP